MEAENKLRMTPEQREQFNQLTRLQQRVLINVLSGMNGKQAYLAAGGKCKPEHANACSSQILANPHLSSLINSLQASAASSALVTAEELVLRLREEAGLNVPLDDDNINQSGRLSAIKMLSDYTGGFDKNRNRVEIGETTYQPLTLVEFVDGLNSKTKP